LRANKFLFLAFILAASGSAFGGVSVASLSYLSGSVSVMREGKVITEIRIGDSILNYDVIRTGKDGTAEILLGGSSGMKGSLSVRPSTVFQYKAELVAERPSSTFEITVGSVLAKVAKVAEKATMNVRTESAVLGVRGTTFTVTASVLGDLLVICAEGKVAIIDTGGTARAEALPGTAVSKLSGSPFESVAVAPDAADDFEREWSAARMAAFGANSANVIGTLAAIYAAQYDAFTKAVASLSRNPIIRKWTGEDLRGEVVRPNDPTVMKEKTELIGPLLDARKPLVPLGSAYYRARALAEYVNATMRKRALPVFGTVAGFLNRLGRDPIEKSMAVYHYVEALFAERNEGRVAGSTEAGGDFFDSAESIEDFFK
jgi:hypothetical protein